MSTSKAKRALASVIVVGAMIAPVVLPVATAAARTSPYGKGDASAVVREHKRHAPEALRWAAFPHHKG